MVMQDYTSIDIFSLYTPNRELDAFMIMIVLVRVGTPHGFSFKKTEGGMTDNTTLQFKISHHYIIIQRHLWYI